MGHRCALWPAAPGIWAEMKPVRKGAPAPAGSPRAGRAAPCRDQALRPGSSRGMPGRGKPSRPARRPRPSCSPRRHRSRPSAEARTRHAPSASREGRGRGPPPPPHCHRQTRPEPHPSPQRQRLAAVGHVRPPLLHPSLLRAEARTRRASLRIAGRAGEGATARPPHSHRQTRPEPHPSPQRQRLAAVGHVRPSLLPQSPPRRGPDKTRLPPHRGEGRGWGQPPALHTPTGRHAPNRTPRRNDNASPRSGTSAPHCYLSRLRADARTRRASLPLAGRAGEGATARPSHSHRQTRPEPHPRHNDNASPRSGTSAPLCSTPASPAPMPGQDAPPSPLRGRGALPLRRQPRLRYRPLAPEGQRLGAIVPVRPPAPPPQLPPRQGPDRTRLPSPSRGGGPPPGPAHPGSPGSSRATSRRNDSASPRSGASISSA